MMAEEENFKDINTVYSLINVEPIEMEFGYSLIPTRCRGDQKGRDLCYQAVTDGRDGIDRKHLRKGHSALHHTDDTAFP